MLFQDAVQIVRTIPELNDKDFVKAVKPLLQEYLEHGDSKEVKVSQFKPVIIHSLKVAFLR